MVKYPLNPLYSLYPFILRFFVPFQHEIYTPPRYGFCCAGFRTTEKKAGDLFW